jgi:hypothetical protein
MLKIDRDKKALESVQRIKLADAGLTERYNLQRMIRTSPETFFKEIGERLLLIAEEVMPSTLVGDRIDLLAVDEKGRAAVIELKRGSDRLQLLQALSYAAMLSSWESDFFREKCVELAEHNADIEEALREHIGPDLTLLNHEQRIILIAEEFDWEVLATAQWLTEKYGLDIRCFRIGISTDGGAHYLSCACIYPPPELEDHVRSRGTGPAPNPRVKKTWEEVLGRVRNPAVLAFFKAQLDQGVENRPTNQDVAYRDGEGKRRYWAGAYKKFAYVTQQGRFRDDIDFWLRTLGSDCDPKPIFEGTVLRFYLSTGTQFDAFTKFLADTLPTLEFDEAAANLPSGVTDERS